MGFPGRSPEEGRPTPSVQRLERRSRGGGMGIFFRCTKQTYTTAAEKRLMPGKPNLETLIHKTLLPCYQNIQRQDFFWQQSGQAADVQGAREVDKGNV